MYYASTGDIAVSVTHPGSDNKDKLVTPSVALAQVSGGYGGLSVTVTDSVNTAADVADYTVQLYTEAGAAVGSAITVNKGETAYVTEAKAAAGHTGPLTQGVSYKAKVTANPADTNTFVASDASAYSDTAVAGKATQVTTTVAILDASGNAIASTPEVTAQLLAGTSSLTLTAKAYDQYGDLMATQPNFTWAVSETPDNVSVSGGVVTFDLGAAIDTYTITATADSVSGSQEVSLVDGSASSRAVSVVSIDPENGVYNTVYPATKDSEGSGITAGTNNLTYTVLAAPDTWNNAGSSWKTKWYGSEDNAKADTNGTEGLPTGVSISTPPAVSGSAGYTETLTYTNEATECWIRVTVANQNYLDDISEYVILHVQKAPSVATYVAIADPTSTTIDVSSSDQPVSLTASVYDQYGVAMAGAITWSGSFTAAGSQAENIPDIASATTGSFTVPAGAKAGTYTMTATSGAFTDSVVFTVTRDAQTATTIDIYKSGNATPLAGTDTIIIPALSASDPAAGAYTAEVYDQYGILIADAALTAVWSGDTSSYITTGTPNNGTSTASATLSVTKELTASKTPVLTFTNGSASAHVDITVQRDTTRTPTSIKLYAWDGSAYGAEITEPQTIFIPVTGSAAASYKAKVFDQYGEEISSTYTLSGGGLDSARYAITNGVLAVTVPSYASLTGGASYSTTGTIKATVSDTEISAEFGLVIHRADAVLTSMAIYNSSDAAVSSASLIIPATDTPNSYTYHAKALDQYGVEMSGKSYTLSWDPQITGVSFAYTNNPSSAATSTITIDKTASASATQTLTATSESVPGIGSKTTSLTVTLVNLDITWPAAGTVTYAADPVYGITNGGLVTNLGSLSYSAKVGETSVPGTLTIKNAGELAPAGTTSVIFVFTPDSGTPYYGSSFESSAFTLPNSASVARKTLTVTGLTAAAGDSGVYNGSTAVVISGTPELHGIVGTDDVTVDSAPAAGTVATADIGTGKAVTFPSVTIKGAKAANYTVTQPSLTVNITAKALTVTGLTATAGDSGVYNGSTAVVISGTAELQGIVGIDDVSVDSTPTAGTVASANVGSGKAVTFGSSITIKGAKSGNYTVTQPSLTADITARELTVTGLAATNRVYDGSVNVGITGTAALVGVIGADTGSVSVGSAPTTGTVAAADIGSGKAVSFSNITLAGAKMANYTVTQPTLTVDITTRTLTVTPNSSQTKAYGGSDPALTYTYSGNVSGQTPGFTGALNRATGENVGTYDITNNAVEALALADNGSFKAANYTLSFMTGVKFAITPATITITTSEPSHTVLANDAANTSTSALKAIANGGGALPATVDISFSGTTDIIGIVWADATETFSAKGGTYTYVGTVAEDSNYAGRPTLIATVTVSPVTVQEVKKDASTALDTTVTVAKADALSASVTSLADIGVPLAAYLTFDSVAAMADQTIVWDKTISDVKALANTVTDTSGDKSITLTVQSGTYPGWATSPAAAQTFTITITNKYPVSVAFTTPVADVTYGETLTEPVAEQAAIAHGTDSAGTFTYTYSGTGSTAYGPSTTAPTAAGTYKVTAALVSDTHSGTAEDSFTIGKKALSNAMITGITPASNTYTGSAITPTPAVADASGPIVSADYTVSYSSNISAGSAAKVIITATASGNYTGAAEYTFTINKAELTGTPTITGTAAVGSVLTANPGYPESEVTYQWTRGGSDISGAVGKTYTLVPADSNQDIAVKVTGANVNYQGTSTITSAAKTAAKMAISGAVVITGGSSPVIADDTLTAVITGMLPAEAQTGASYQWTATSGGTTVDLGAAATQTLTDLASDTVVTVTVTPNANYTGTLSVSVTIGKTPISATFAVSGVDPLTAAVGDVITPTGQVNDEDLTASGADYTLQWMRNGADISGATGATYTVVTADLGCTITLKAVGKGDYTGTVLAGGSAVVPALKPAAPAIYASAGDGQVTVTWTAPAANGSPILGYTLYMKEGTGSYDSGTQLDSGAASYTYTGLTNGTAYTFKLTAANAVGTSDESNEPTATPYTPHHGGGTTKYSISASAGAGGRISPAGASVTKGDDQTFSIIADDGYGIKDVLVDGVSVGAVSSYTFENVTDSHSIKAVFEKTEAPTEPFTDVEPDDWYAEAVNYVYANGLMNGMTETEFGPDTRMDRAMIVTVLWRLAGETQSESGLSFGDVPSGSYYEQAVRFAVENGITAGRGGDIFDPTASVTREEMAVFFYRFAQYMGYDVSANTDLSGYSDASGISDWAQAAMAWANAAGIITGRTGTTLSPGGDATRAEIATIIMRFVQYCEAQ